MKGKVEFLIVSIFKGVLWVKVKGFVKIEVNFMLRRTFEEINHFYQDLGGALLEIRLFMVWVRFYQNQDDFFKIWVHFFIIFDHTF